MSRNRSGLSALDTPDLADAHRPLPQRPSIRAAEGVPEPQKIGLTLNFPPRKRDKLHTFPLRLYDSQVLQLEALSAVAGVSPSEYARELIAAGLNAVQAKPDAHASVQLSRKP